MKNQVYVIILMLCTYCASIKENNKENIKKREKKNIINKMQMQSSLILKNRSMCVFACASMFLLLAMQFLPRRWDANETKGKCKLFIIPEC